MKIDHKPNTAYVTTATLSKILNNLTPARIQQLTNEGHIIRHAHGKYDLWQSIRLYVKYLQDRTIGLKKTDTAYHTRATDTPRIRLEIAKARLAELEANFAEGTHIPISDVTRIYTEHITTARTLLLTLPARVPSIARSAVKTLINEVLSELSNPRTTNE